MDFEKGTVSWAVNGTTRKTVKNKYIKDKTVKWVPHLWIYYKSAVALVS